MIESALAFAEQVDPDIREEVTTTPQPTPDTGTTTASPPGRGDDNPA